MPWAAWPSHSQVSATSAGLREVALLVLEAHRRASAAEAVRGQGGEAAMRQTMPVLGRALRP